MPVKPAYSTPKITRLPGSLHLRSKLRLPCIY
ncbi:hypothetical protein FOWG_18280 [Fusarium oxysporum f. sp. lycopersici MN25]|nr:hypothetical protein FOWG_18280 [Fusarium oxysporum f. sp. lycopersici MN25]